MEYLEYLGLIQMALTIWMLIDAYRRQAEPIWFWIILLTWGVGAWVYFFVVKLPDFSVGSLFAAGPRRPSLDELRYRAEQTPTLSSRLDLAEGLIDRGHHAEAIPSLEAARKQEPDHCQVLYLLALCHTEQGHPEKGLPLLDQVINRDRGWGDYAAWRLKVAARAQGGDSPGALAVSRELVRLAPTLQHRCLLVERLLADGLMEEARHLLDESLEAYRFAPGPVRRRDRRWAGHAKQLKKRVRVTSRA